ncbi:RNA-directed DNA polymerase [Roseiconus lacunae]|uniref:RNA-directed DNA polymerase n=1 Tax=Roseiconus lacunae TaxID=2605694 RepID=UPI001E39EAC6|nr:RNA-directed DNA polymerase [Roseiconus lacunae]MCD0458834.1 RNA-directed DNA polymerase [Roseiconus lacunae]
MRRLDIQGCFSNIYTHTISWAIRGKAEAKDPDARNAWYTVDSAFDRIWRSVNHNETHGILIGPEASRIFAELILQEVDAIAEKAILEKHGLSHGREFEVRRYVDDYFLFANENSVCDRVEERIRRCLAIYKLQINESKTDQYEKPFTSKLSSAKRMISRSFQEILDRALERREDGVPRRINLERDLLSQFKMVVSQFDCRYEECTGYAFTVIADFATRLPVRSRIQLLDAGVIALAARFLELDFRYSIAIRVTRFFLELSSQPQADQAAATELKRRVDSHVATEFISIVSNALGRSPVPGQELASFLVATASIDSIHRSASSAAKLVWDWCADEASEDKLDYFSVISILYFCGNRTQYDNLRIDIIASCRHFLEASRTSHQRADSAMLCADLATCPFIRRSDREFFAGLLKSWTQASVSKRKIAADAWGTNMFFDWGLRGYPDSSDGTNDDVDVTDSEFSSDSESTLFYMVEKKLLVCYE